MKRNRLIAAIAVAALLMGTTAPAFAEEPSAPVYNAGEELMFQAASDPREAAAQLEKARTQMTDHAETPLERVPAADASRIVVNAAFCGVVVERSGSDEVEISLAGAADAAAIQAGAVVEPDGTLRLTARGSEKLGYVSTVPDGRVNTVVFRVPDLRYRSVSVTADAGAVRICELPGTFDGKTTDGTILLADETLKGTCRMESDSGRLLLSGETVEGDITLKTRNGSAGISGRAVTARVSMDAQDGALRMDANTLGQTKMIARGGDVLLDARELTKDVYVKTDTGLVWVNLRDFPRDAAFIDRTENPGETQLPPGWEGGYNTTNGDPELKMLCKSGKAKLTLYQNIP